MKQKMDSTCKGKRLNWTAVSHTAYSATNPKFKFVWIERYWHRQSFSDQNPGRTALGKLPIPNLTFSWENFIMNRSKTQILAFEWIHVIVKRLICSFLGSVLPNSSSSTNRRTYIQPWKTRAFLSCDAEILLQPCMAYVDWIHTSHSNNLGLWDYSDDTCPEFYSYTLLQTYFTTFGKFWIVTKCTRDLFHLDSGATHAIIIGYRIFLEIAGNCFQFAMSEELAIYTS